MALIKDIHYTYRDVTILPGVTSSIEHRAECNPFNPDGMLPLFTAPMNSVINLNNHNLFEKNGINPILPRTERLADRIDYACQGKWAAFSLNEFSEAFCISSDKYKGNAIKALIDVANGHMEKILELCRSAKGIYGNKIKIMAGNIANPETYLEYAKTGIDYVRCGIGSGMGCLSTSNTGVHMPMASLIDEVKTHKGVLESFDDLEGMGYRSIPMIVADGGIRNYSDIIKALALGADYVMCGGIFAAMIESAADKSCNSDDWYRHDIKFSELSNFIKNNNSWYGKYNNKYVFLGDISATFYGMASKEGQIALNGSKTKTSEGLSKSIPVLYTMGGWTNNFTDYLRSAMSYAGAHTLEEFKNRTNLIVNSENAINVVNK